MPEVIFETKWVGYTTTVYPNRLTQKGVMGQEVTIPISQITGIDLGLFFYAGITIQTADGKKHKFPVKIKDKGQLRDAIYSEMRQ